MESLSAFIKVVAVMMASAMLGRMFLTECRRTRVAGDPWLTLKFVLFLAENKNHPRHSGAGRHPVYTRAAALSGCRIKPGMTKILGTFMWYLGIFHLSVYTFVCWLKR